MRADLFLVDNGYAKSRAEAQAAIKTGNVFADGKPVSKPSQNLSKSMQIEYAPAHPYVSRGALKLIAALDRFGLSPEGLTCLDLGASTGGFSEVLLERGARMVFAVDVGHDQLHAQIASDPRVVSIEHQNARDLSTKSLVGSPEAIVADLSFISLRLGLPPALRMAAPNAWLIALFKPQFEVGRDKIGKGGIVKDSFSRTRELIGFLQWLNGQGDWRFLSPPFIESPILGADGNLEFLVAARNDGLFRPLGQVG
ncbi:MAG TPA: TlyA family RNA methyltransferase [Rhizomicrobium sp.]|nr:TlyA family RNA methyltransferase [Rhizomicrobium sp.]